MDLNQRKLTKAEWNSIEHPVTNEELSVLQLIRDGYNNVNIKLNKNLSLFSFLKIAYNPKVEEFLFNKYFRSEIEGIEKYILKINPSYKKINISAISRLNSADRIRLDKNETIDESKAFEFTLLKHTKKLIKYYLSSQNEQNNHVGYHFYTLQKLMKTNILNINSFVKTICHYVLNELEPKIELKLIIQNGVDILEKNKSLLKFSDMELYEHQKQIFTVCKKPNPKLVLSIAPTGTGKTLTPIGLSEQNRIIFVCAARHVGLALARSAISIKKKVAFAFGCETADDIRLHYFAAKDYTKNRRTGGIGKVDNSVGDNVEIMICDIMSYLPAMYYMLAFNRKENLILYWDEPTITMDYDTHEFHEAIHKNWKENLIPNSV